MLVYLNGDYVPHSDARVSVDDRGFLFADGAYEVVRVYNGNPFLIDAHLRRLEQGLRSLRIPFDDAIESFNVIADRLLDENDLRAGDASIYIQITRGAAQRSHPFPEDATPTIYAAAKAYQQHPDSFFQDGVDAITVPDQRWTRCDIKSVSLLPNVLASQRAREADAFEALLVRDGVIIEGAHANVFAVMDGTLVTYPACNYILAGITRAQVLDMAAERGVPIREGAIPEEALFTDVDELFLSGTTTEVMPLVRVNGREIRDGTPGPLTLRLQTEYRGRTQAG